MSIKIALAGNPNCGKTTLFNELTGSSQYVGNWPGVTVEKKDGLLKGHKDVIIQDLPGIYSLSPYTLEEKVARNYLVNDRPDVILNIIDGTNLERNLYLTTQLAELHIPMLLVFNIADEAEKKGLRFDLPKLERYFGAGIVQTVGSRGNGIVRLREALREALGKLDSHGSPQLKYGPDVDDAISAIAQKIDALSLPGFHHIHTGR